VERLYTDFAIAYVRGRLPEATHGLPPDDILALGQREGLKLHRFKRTMGLPRVRAVLGALQGISPANLLDIGTGRGVFLWPLLDAFPHLPVTAVEPDDQRASHLEAVRRGGLNRLAVLIARAENLPFETASFDAVTALEVIEHQADPLPLAREAVRLAARFVVVSVPSKPDDNPEHVQLFTGKTLEALLLNAGAQSVRTDYVLNHIVAVARTSPA
jgi:ubiquinone/menaquinone biosynthesis C-methylase UbiE